jgi:hypothetical protein
VSHIYFTPTCKKEIAAMKNLKKSLWMSSLVALSVVAFGVFAYAQSETEAPAMAFEGMELLPPGAEPGECYARLFVPPTYKTLTEEVLKNEASERLEIIPASYKWETQEVMVKGPSERLETIPATYGWTEETVMTRQESTRLEEVPQVFETVAEKVLERSASTAWKKGTGPIEKMDNATGEIMCLVEVPARYKTVYKRVLAKPAATREITIPAQYQTIKKQVMTNPPTTRKIEIPAEYKTVKVKKLATPAEVKRFPIPAQYQTVTSRVKVTEGKMEWRRILCQTNLDRATVANLQRALLKAGHSPGPIDGVIGRETLSALRAYQEAKGLAVGNLTYETLKSLGIKPASAS